MLNWYNLMHMCYINWSDLMGGLGTKRDEVPEHVGILQVGLRVPLLSVDETRKEEWITDEKNWSVVPCKYFVGSYKFNQNAQKCDGLYGVLDI